MDEKIGRFFGGRCFFQHSGGGEGAIDVFHQTDEFLGGQDIAPGGGLGQEFPCFGGFTKSHHQAGA